MKRKTPSDNLRGLPCSIVAVRCALGGKAKGTPILKDGGYATLASMNKFVRENLPVVRQIKFKRGERPKLKDLHLDGRAIVCVLGHFLYLDHEDYWSFFKNSGDDVVSVWVLG